MKRGLPHGPLGAIISGMLLASCAGLPQEEKEVWLQMGGSRWECVIEVNWGFSSMRPPRLEVVK